MNEIVFSAGTADRRSGLLELWQFRELLRTLTVRHLKVKYKRSALGFVWTLLNPLLTVLTLGIVFSYILKVDVPDYWAFLVSGFFVWNFILLTLSASPNVLAENAALARSVPVPTDVFVLAAIAARLVEFLLEMMLILPALILLHHHGVPGSFLLLPLLIVLQVLLATGLTLPLATLAVFYDDVQHGLPVVLLMLFYISPVFYPARLVPEAAQGLYALNPIAGLLTIFQRVLYDGQAPSVGALAAQAAIAVSVCVFGFLVFRHYRGVFPEIL